MPPKGWKKAGETPVKKEVSVEFTQKVDEKPVVVPPVVVVPQVVALSQVEESRKSLNQTLDPGQAFFEAPDGFIMVGESTADRMFYRAGNGGQGYWINKRRA